MQNFERKLNKNLQGSKKSSNFVPRISATPLYNAYQGGTFILYAMKYTKLPLSLKDQLLLLQQRGLSIDSKSAEQSLSAIGYFRFAEYLRPMEHDKQLHQFKDGSTFSNALQLYKFDRQLRTILFDAIQTIEIVLRSQMIQCVSMKFGSHWYLDPGLFKDADFYAATNNKILQELKRSREDYIQEYYTKYNDPAYPPVWKTLEVVSLGTLSKLFENLSDKAVKRDVARSFGLPQHLFLESWIQCVAVLRNLCCHHNRVWNRRYAVKPQIPCRLPNPWINEIDSNPAKLYWMLCTIQYMLRAIRQGNTFTEDIRQLLACYPQVDIAAMGFPAKWQSEPLWAE